jgi:hypothetical protein
MPLVAALAAVLALGVISTVHADGELFHYHHTLPGEVPAYDFATGGEYMAPPVPYGHYAKDQLGRVHKAGGMLLGLLHGGGLGHGCGLFGHGCGSGNGCGLGHGCGGNGDSGCGFCAGKGLFHHGNGGCGSTIAPGGLCDSGYGSGHGHKKNFAPCHASTVAATSQNQPVAQAVVMPSGQALCRRCGGAGCGICGGIGVGDPCSSCGGSGRGCGLCGGCGLFKHGHGGTGCGLCGGKGCASCLKGLASKAHGLLGGLLHRGNVEYFVGAGGPVPLTPGYVPYIVSTRSPREFFAFPPMNPNDP